MEDYKGKRQAAEESHRGKVERDRVMGGGYEEDGYEEGDSSLEDTFNRILGLGG